MRPVDGNWRNNSSLAFHDSSPAALTMTASQSPESKPIRDETRRQFPAMPMCVHTSKLGKPMGLPSYPPSVKRDFVSRILPKSSSLDGAYFIDCTLVRELRVAASKPRDYTHTVSPFDK